MNDEERRRAVEQSFAAVRELALGMGVLRERLEGACDALLQLESKEIPVGQRPEFMELISSIMEVENLDELADAAATALALRMLVFHEKILLDRS